MFGATGAIGRLVVNALAKDARIAKVTAIVRGEKDAAFWFLDANEWTKVEQLVLLDVSTVERIKCDLGFCCIGLYAANGTKEAYFREVEVGVNTKAAAAMREGGCRRCCYLSGAGVTGKGMLFSRVKGAAEVSLRDVGFEVFSCFRPPGIMDRPGKRVYGPPESFINSSMRWLLRTSMFVRAEDVAWAMLSFSFSDAPRPVYEARAIKAEAKAFECEQKLTKTRYRLGM